ncbi:uncharacterized protein BCR38DRAFT_453398 [Pseudomassariella vexata]|uniref:Uncharacterized protein n=1 Tax=Pseudomassariella vexata TaxID=1141098 RepID=A0A1Y2D5I3_9PEZI|nr:uncharacterized protein BCR38DRAFT_453398 [Pseudomassariella vexata]ORY54541.1 hypothetical protein BCR38DRAFT_453398 [Pseudomassariella vexata]
MHRGVKPYAAASVEAESILLLAALPEDNHDLPQTLSAGGPLVVSRRMSHPSLNSFVGMLRRPVRLELSQDLALLVRLCCGAVEQPAQALHAAENPPVGEFGTSRFCVLGHQSLFVIAPRRQELMVLNYSNYVNLFSWRNGGAVDATNQVLIDHNLRAG